MLECARMTEYPVISLGDPNSITFWMRLYLRVQSIIFQFETTYDMHQLINQPTRVDDKTSSASDIIITSNPALHRKNAVLKYTLSDQYLIYTHTEFENTKPSVVDHNTMNFWWHEKFRYGEFLQSSNFMWHS